MAAEREAAPNARERTIVPGQHRSTAWIMGNHPRRERVASRQTFPDADADRGPRTQVRTEAGPGSQPGCGGSEFAPADEESGTSEPWVSTLQISIHSAR